MPIRPTHLLAISSLTLGALLLAPVASQASSKVTVSTVLRAAKNAMIGEKSVHLPFRTLVDRYVTNYEDADFVAA